MDRFLIYQDDEIKVEIDYSFHIFLKETQPKFINLEDKEYNFVLALVISILEAQIGYNSEENNKLIGNIPVIKAGHALSLQPPYDDFNEILHYLSLFPNLDERTTEIMKDINDCFEEKHFYCHIFPHKIFDVKGFITYKKDEKLIIMMFGFQENNQSFDFLDFL